jgi:hypothetical protein
MSWLARRVVSLYPARWRERYGDELRGMLDEMRIGPREVIDLGMAAIGERIREGRAMRGDPGIWLSRVAGGIGILVALPSAIFVVVNLLQYQFGLLVDESSRWWIENSSGALAMTGHAGGPVLAIALAVIGMGQFGFQRGADGELVVTGRFRRTWPAIVALGLGGLVLAIVIGYGISESVLEALRAPG